MSRITVLLADDHNLVRQGFRALLSAERDFEVVGEADNGRQAVRDVRRQKPDVAILDIAMPHLNGIEALKQIKKVSPTTRVLILSMYVDEEYVQQAVEAGADGYLVKGAGSSDLAVAIREILKGNAYFSPAVSKMMTRQLRARPEPGAVRMRLIRLSAREREVLQLIAEGLSNKEIAFELSISVKTVEKHRQSVMDKLDVHTIAGLTRYAVRHGIVERPEITGR